MFFNLKETWLKFLAHFHKSCSSFQVGWRYGTVTEGIQTGLTIHRKGLKSISCIPNPPGFLGTAPTSGLVCLIQKKRWTTGMLQVLFSKNSPIMATLNAKLGFRQCLAYLRVLIWGVGSIFYQCYSLLPAYCITTNSNFLPKVYISMTKFYLIFSNYAYRFLLPFWISAFRQI